MDNKTQKLINVSFCLNLEQFFPNDSFVYDVFGLFQCILIKANNLLYFTTPQNTNPHNHNKGFTPTGTKALYVVMI